MIALLCFAGLVLAWWVFAALLSRTDHTVTDALGHAGALLLAVAYTLAHLAHIRSDR